ncbi:MAG: hypothetical protein SOI13_01430 [Bifidobacterium mongoliense]|jgi:hypothetical protein|uniref:hypothetical protein n=1 Tax=Bifidobacterium mongoliense TaxID=518643 RepID=UPI002F35F0F0
MSIATDEALHWHDHYDWAHRGRAMFTSVIDEAYVAGRTAEVTDAEVKAVMNEWSAHGYTKLEEGAPLVCNCGANLKDWREFGPHLLRALLEAARKAVMA